MAELHQVKFSEATLERYRELLTHYATRQAALLPTLWLAMEQFGWISPEVERYVAELMELPPSHVRAVVSFYPMFHRQPVGRYHLAICTNIACRLRGAEKIVESVRARLGLAPGEVSADGKFSYETVECLASCGTAPMLQLSHGQYYENLTPESVIKLIDELASRAD